jgi:hypothetical protein
MTKKASTSKLRLQRKAALPDHEVLTGELALWAVVLADIVGTLRQGGHSQQVSEARAFIQSKLFALIAAAFDYKTAALQGHLQQALAKGK